MKLVKEILWLLHKDGLLEWRSGYALGGILLYVLSTVYILYASFEKIEPPLWNALFWIVILFASVNAITKSFVQESGARQLYYYSLLSPISLILAKIIYNVALLLLLSLLSWGAFTLFAENAVTDNGLFFLAIFLATLGFSITFTFISAISAKANNSSTLMAILCFPLIIPIIMTLINLSKMALDLKIKANIENDLYTLLGIDALLLGMTLVLYPFLWRD